MTPAAHLRPLYRALPGLTVAAVLGIFFLNGCSSSKESAPTPVVTVQTAPVVQTALQQWVDSEGVLYPLHEAILTPKVAAPIQRFLVNRGDRVHKGQLLAILENQDLRAAAQENRGLYQQAQATYQTETRANLPQQLTQAQLDTDAARQNFDAQQRIYSSRQHLFRQGAIARRDVEQVGVALAQARSQYEIARKHLESLQAIGQAAQKQAAAGQLTAAQARYQGARAQLGYTEVRSPLDGVVTDRPLYPGQQAGAGTPLMTIMEISQVVARIHIAPDQAALLHVGDPATLITLAGNPVPARVQLISPAVDPSSTTIEVWVQAANPGGELRPGTSARVRILARTVPHAIVIPTAAVLSNPDGGVYVMRAGADGQAHQISVETGLKGTGDNGEDDTQILKGLTPGEQVVTVGGYGLPDGTRIRVASGTPAAPRESREGTKDKS